MCLRIPQGGIAGGSGRFLEGHCPSSTPYTGIQTLLIKN